MALNDRNGAGPARPKKEKKVIDVTPKKGRGAKLLINFAVTLVFGFVYFYIKLPAINLHAQEFYFFFFLLAAVYVCTAIVTSGIWKLRGQDDFFPSVKNNFKIPLFICAGFLALILIGTFLSSAVIRARSYRDLMTVETGDFASEVAEVNYSQIPMLDRDSAQRLGDRKLGELSDMVSQFEVADDYTQINYKGRPVRVTPLEYGDLIKWLTNRSKGLPAYIVVDMVDQSVEVVRLSEGMKYTTTEHFSRNLMRHLRFQYPTFLFDTPVFEIDDEGTPYWVCPRLVRTIGLFGGNDARGAVLVNAITGESEYYETVPQWVDHVYSAELIIQQYDYHGTYVNGFLNSMFGQRGVTVTTDGYNYIAMNDDVYVYTGVTSVGTDQSNIGFILTNQRTKETRFYSVAGAEEYSAMSSAEGVVQHLNYKATFPLLLNIGGQPTYFMALKDNAELVKQYAMVNVAQYQIVATGASVAECEKNYRALLASNNIESSASTTAQSVTGVVAEVRSAVLDGNSVYYIRIEGSETFYAVRAADNSLAVIVGAGDTVKITFSAADGAILSADSFEIVSKAAPADTLTPAASAAADAAPAA